VASDCDGVGKPPAHKITTDGCGFINAAALIAIGKKLDCPRPTAVQARIGGAKGLWILDPDNTDDVPIIWIRTSQIKIKGTISDRAHRILDLLDVSRPSSNPSNISLNPQALMNLSFNGVPDEIFTQLMEKGLNDRIAPLMEWSSVPGSDS
jgi:hypothetical protein